MQIQLHFIEIMAKTIYLHNKDVEIEKSYAFCEKF